MAFSAIVASDPPKPNISKEEKKAIYGLQKEESVMVLPADKGRATVLVDREEYKQKVHNMLSDEKTYTKLKSNPTQKFKRQLVSILSRLKKEGKIEESDYKYLYPTSEITPRMYCTPKVHKPNTPFRPIVDYTGSIAYNTSRSLADILVPMVGNTEHHIKNSKHLAQEMCSVILEEDEVFVSHDVVSLFTNVPIKEALKVIRDSLERDTSLNQRTKLTPDDLIELLEFVLTTTYFSFDGQLYQQKFGTAMGSPVSPVVANLYMEFLEKTAIATAPVDCKPRFWKRYVDDICEAIRKNTEEALTEHLNQVDPTNSIKFTFEKENQGQMPFLDTLLVRRDSGEVKLLVYRKSTHTDQYLSFESHHPLNHKLGVIRTLLDRCTEIVTDEQDRVAEIQHVKTALARCGYPEWAFKRVESERGKSEEKKSNQKKKR